MKALYALVFVLFSFAAPAQTPETWRAASYLDDIDCFGETIQQGTMPPQIIGIELFCAAMLNEAVSIAITGSNDAEDVSGGAIQPNHEHSTLKYSTWNDDELAVGDTIEPNAASTQIIATEPTVETLGEAKLSEADDVAVTKPNLADDASVGSIQPSDEGPDGKILDRERHTLTGDNTTEQGAVPTQLASKPTIEKYSEVDEADDVAITGPNSAEDVPVGAIQPIDGYSIATYSSRSDDQSTVDDTIE